MKFLIFTILIFFLVTSCQKEFNYDNSLQATGSTAPTSIGAAMYTFDGAPNSCTNISKAGVYVTNVPLTNLNKVKIDVNVMVPGTYSITTPLIDGFSFSGSGKLETMGFGTVMLQATGTPLASGTFIFTPSNNGCPFLISVIP